MAPEPHYRSGNLITSPVAVGTYAKPCWLKPRVNLHVFLGLLLLVSGSTHASEKDSETDQNINATTTIVPVSSASATCGVALEEASNLADLLTSATEQLFSFANGAVSKQVSFEEDCSMKLSFVQHHANYLLSQLKLMKADAHLYKKVIMHMMTSLTYFNELAENVKLSHRQPTRQDDTLNTNLAALQQQVNSLFYQTGKLHGQNRDSGVKQFIAHLKAGRAEAALEHFNRINDISLMGAAIRQAYNDKRNPDNVELIVEFTRLLSNCSLDNIVYSALFDEMKKYGNLNKPEVLSLYEGTEPCSTPLQNIRRQLVAHVNSVISKWADKIKNNVTDEITRFAEKGSASRNLLAAYIPKLVTSSFSNTMSNFGAVLNFAAGLTDPSLSSKAFSSLLSEVKRADGLYSNEIVRFAYKLKETMDFGTFNVSAENSGQFENLKNALPRIVVQLIWNGSNCTAQKMRNSRNRKTEYLYADKHFHDANRRAFTWLPAELPTEAFWAFETEDGGQSFTIKNNHWNEYLYASDAVDSNRIWVLLSAEEPRGRHGIWNIKPVDDSKFTILSRFSEGCLYSDVDINRGVPPNSRAAFTWRTSGIDMDTIVACHWVISC